MTSNVLGLREYFANITNGASKVADVVAAVQSGTDQVVQAQINTDVTRDNAKTTGNFNVATALKRTGPGGIPTWALALGLVGFYLLVLK